jgi:uncharacterized protein (UPF0248 family)
MQAAPRGTSSANTTMFAEQDVERLDDSFVEVKQAAIPHHGVICIVFPVATHGQIS